MGFEAITTKRTHRVYHRAATFADLANDAENGFRELESRVVVVEPELQILRNRLKTIICKNVILSCSLVGVKFA